MKSSKKIIYRLLAIIILSICIILWKDTISCAVQLTYRLGDSSFTYTRNTQGSDEYISSSGVGAVLDNVSEYETVKKGQNNNPSFYCISKGKGLAEDYGAKNQFIIGWFIEIGPRGYAMI